MSRTRCWSPRVRSFRSADTDAFLPPGALATMVLFIEPLVITLTLPVLAPIRIRPLKILPVMGISPVPCIPPRRIPVLRSDPIGGRISVIRAPPVLRTEKEIQDSVQEPITVVIYPRRIRPHPRIRVRVRGRGRILVGLSLSRPGHGGDRASTQQNG